MTKNKSQPKERFRGYTRRRVNYYPIRQRFLIVCEGKKTEPLYFKKYRASGLVVHVDGEGCDPLSIVREALKQREAAQVKIPYDQVWCVFDRDFCPIGQFNAAFELAHRNHIEIAYSNQSFELWYLLHFQYQITAISRQDYIHRLSKLLGHLYEKNSETIFNELYSRRSEALRNAQRLLETYQPLQPADNDPSTTVHLLVEQLIHYGGPISPQ